MNKLMTIAEAIKYIDEQNELYVQSLKDRIEQDNRERALIVECVKKGDLNALKSYFNV